MKKILIAIMAVMLVTMFAGTALALDPRGMGLPKFAAPGSEDVVTFKYNSRASLPSGFLIFNGDGTEFWLRTTVNDTISTAASVPSNIMITAPNPTVTATQWIYKLYINCATDSVAVYPVKN